MKLQVGVLFGGCSTEHDISIITGLQVMHNLDPKKYNIIPLYLTKDNEILSHRKLLNIDFYKQNIKTKGITYTIYSNKGVGWLSNISKKFHFRKKIDLIFNCTHGYRVEDGSISGLLNYLKIPYSSPDILTSSICQDKDYTKIILKELKVPVLDYIVLKEKDKLDLEYYSRMIEYPVIIKPAHLGSSIGIKIAYDYNELLDGVNYGFIYDNKLIIEKYLNDSVEYSVALYKRKNDLIISRIEEISKTKEIFDFKDKYIDFNKTYNHIYLDDDSELAKKIKEISKKVYNKLEMKGIIRIDFIKSSDLFLNEINTIPGSLANYLFKNISFKTLLDEQVREMLYEYKYNQRYKTSFETSVLNNNYKFYKK